MALSSRFSRISRRSGSNPASPDLKEESRGTPPELKYATKTRRNIILFACFCYLLALIFLILVFVGNTKDTSSLTNIYFYKIDLSDIIPVTVPNASLVNSIARSLGLHDFYQVGLWNFCEGYNTDGVTYCSPPRRFYWFNPVEVMMNELLSGATIALPTAVLQILDVLKLTSQLMFTFFMTGIVLNFVLICSSIVVLYSRWWSLPGTILSLISVALIFAASVIGTVQSVAFKVASTSQSELNIKASLGTEMFVFMWLATGFTGLAFIIHSGLGCCFASRRDVRTGRKAGHKPRQGTMQSGARSPTEPKEG